jgi:hypothetical protein
VSCYECAKASRAEAAVATCRKCGAGLCLHHLREAAVSFPAGGTTYACPHDTWSPEAARAALGLDQRDHGGVVHVFYRKAKVA